MATLAQSLRVARASLPPVADSRVPLLHALCKGRNPQRSTRRFSFLSSPMERLDLWLFLVRCLPHIEVGLQLVPDFSVGAERGGKTQ
jgi:hypothetical protein